MGNTPSALINTAIWKETAAADNPFLATACACHGYDLMELCRQRTFVEVLLLLFCGELPTPAQTSFCEKLMIGLINPGPRHPAGRAAINAGLGRTSPTHILPIALSCLSGSHLGADEVSAAMRFLGLESGRNIAPETAQRLLRKKQRPAEGDWHVAPGFGSRFNGIDPLPQKLAALLSVEPGCGKVLRWACNFTEALQPHGLGVLATGLAAAVFCDLGLSPWSGAGLFQLLAAPGLLAHGVEAGGHPVATMPSIFDKENYIITKQDAPPNRTHESAGETSFAGQSTAASADNEDQHE